MAMTDPERIGSGRKLLAEGPAAFVDEHMSAAQPDGKDWLTALEAEDRTRWG
ncbi:hypothetical protein [Streptomyces sp. NPDC005336]|uniref:hypothetical protein n=1 Tax=Streptomyces sp. NPDC005336 TaxID=3157035 RepID=UPI0033A177E0